MYDGRVQYRSPRPSSFFFRRHAVYTFYSRRPGTRDRPTNVTVQMRFDPPTPAVPKRTTRNAEEGKRQNRKQRAGPGGPESGEPSGTTTTTTIPSRLRRR